MKNISKYVIFQMHRLLSRVKIHVLPIHYYSPVVNLPELEARRDEWARRSEMPGIEWDGSAQLALMREICLPYQSEYQENSTFIKATQGGFGPGYGPVEAQALHAFVRHFKPARILEVGSGVSTACILEAMRLNSAETGSDSSLTCIEPFPSPHMRSLSESGQVKLIDKIVQQVPLQAFTELEKGDLLFIDSSHAVKTGSDVNHLYLEILPRLKPGVLIHIHDIYLPYDYSPLTLSTLWHWGETSLLRAYMCHNPKIRTLFCMSLMHHDYPDLMKEIFPLYDPEEVKDGLFVNDPGPMGYPEKHFPASIYLQTA